MIIEMNQLPKLTKKLDCHLCQESLLMKNTDGVQDQETSLQQAVQTKSHTSIKCV